MIMFEVGDVFVVRDRHSLVVCDSRDESTSRFPIGHSGHWGHVREYAVKLANTAKLSNSIEK